MILSLNSLDGMEVIFLLVMYWYCSLGCICVQACGEFCMSFMINVIGSDLQSLFFNAVWLCMTILFPLLV